SGTRWSPGEPSASERPGTCARARASWSKDGSRRGYGPTSGETNTSPRRSGPIASCSWGAATRSGTLAAMGTVAPRGDGARAMRTAPRPTRNQHRDPRSLERPERTIMAKRRYRLKLATWTVVREPGALSPRTLSSPASVAELARDLLRDHDDDKEHFWAI